MRLWTFSITQINNLIISTYKIENYEKSRQNKERNKVVLNFDDMSSDQFNA